MGLLPHFGSVPLGFNNGGIEMGAIPKEVTMKICLDATEALETISKLKAELEQVIALQEKAGLRVNK